MFLETKNGYVNTSVIAEIEERNDRSHHYIITLLDGSTRMAHAVYVNKIINQRPVIQSKPGDIAVIATCWEKNEECVGEVEESPIVGWSVEFTEGFAVASPVLIDDVTSNQEMGILMSDGKVLVPYEGTYDTKEDFLKNAIDTFKAMQEARGATKT